MSSNSASCRRDNPRSARSTSRRLYTGRSPLGIGWRARLDPREHQRRQGWNVDADPYERRQESVSVDPHGVAGREVALDEQDGKDHDRGQHPMTRRIRLLSQRLISLVDPHAPSVDAAARVAVGGDQGSQRQRDDDQKDRQNEPPRQTAPPQRYHATECERVAEQAHRDDAPPRYPR